MNMQKLFLTFFGTGLSPKAPGTVGSLAALVVGLLLLKVLGHGTLFMLTLAITIIGIFEINRYEYATKTHDDKQIVIDEVAGMWLTLLMVLPNLESLSYPYIEELAILFSFAAFRLFDIWKPSTIGWIDRELKGGLGVMLDDVLAGIAAGALTLVLLTGIGKLF